MPHFVIDCSANVLEIRSAEDIMNTVYETANASGLFTDNDIKVRVNPFVHYKLGENKKNFFHIFANIMEGRSTEQRSALSRSILENLNILFPGLDILSINISEFDKATYCNKAILDPKNISRDRHYKQ